MKFGRSAWVVEAACTFARRQHEGLLSSDDHHQLFTVFDYDLAYRYNVLGVEPVVIDKARQMANRQPLRAYDAVHLATAWLLNEELLRADKSRLTFVYADERLIAIAQAEVCSPTIPAITPDLASVSPPPKKTVA